MKSFFGLALATIASIFSVVGAAPSGIDPITVATP